MQRWPRVVVLGLITLSGVLALLGVVHWWPDDHRADHVRGLIPFAAPGYVLVHAELIDVRSACTGEKTPGPRCGDSRARVLDGRNADRIVSVGLNPEVIGTGLKPRDRVLLFDSTAVTGPSAATGSAFSFYRADRGGPMLWLAILFGIAVVAVALRRGLMALISLGFAGLVVIGYLIPALLSGQPPIPVTVASSTLILIVMLYLTHGVSMRTSVALGGALIGVALSTVFAWAGIVGVRLGGFGNESASLLSNSVAWINVQQLVVASVILAGLGTLNDVTVTQASALWELRGASPTMPRWELFRRAMRIGRDHVASSVYTLVFAYLGTALVLLVAVQIYGGGPNDFITAEDVAEEIVRTLVGGTALVLAMPITTALGTLIVAGAWTETETETEDHHPVQSRFEDIQSPPHRGSRSPAPSELYRRLPESRWRGD